MKARPHKLLIRLAVSAVVVLLLVRFVPWDKLSQAFSEVPLTTIALVVAGFLGCHLVSTFKWRMVIGVAGAPLPASAAVECYSAGLFSNIFLPSIVGGDVLRALLAGRRSGRMEAAILGGAADRLLDITALGVLALAASFFVGFERSGAMRTLLPLGAALGVVVAIALLVSVSRRPLAKWPPKFRRRIAQVLVALRRQRRKPGTLLISLTGACLIQAAFVGLNALLGAELGIEASASAWLFAASLGKVAGLLPVSFNGIGVRDTAFAMLFVPLVQNGELSNDDKWARTIAVSVVWQAVILIGSLIAGAIWGLLKRRDLPADAAVPQHA